MTTLSKKMTPKEERYAFYLILMIPFLMGFGLASESIHWIISGNLFEGGLQNLRKAFMFVSGIMFMASAIISLQPPTTDNNRSNDTVFDSMFFLLAGVISMFAIIAIPPAL